MPIYKYQKDFVNDHYEMAKKSEADTGVPAVFTLAQAALESYWGKSELATKGNNYFGVKDFDKIPGNEIYFDTREQTKSGQNYIEKGAAFVKYDSAAASFNDHGYFLLKNKRYRDAFATKDEYEWAKIIAKAGYASDKNYYSALCNVINTIKIILGQPTKNLITDLAEFLGFIKPEGVADPSEPADVFIIASDDESVADFIERYGIKMTVEELMAYKNNRKAIAKSYNTKQFQQHNNTASADLIAKGARIAVPVNKMASRCAYLVNQTLTKNIDYNCFVEAEIQRLLSSPKYKKLNVDNDSVVNSGAVYKRQDRITVWLWSKTHDSDLDGGELVDLSPFVQNITLNVTATGGNFTFTLPHLTFSYDKDGNMEIDMTIADDDLSEKGPGKQLYVSKTMNNFKRMFNTVLYKTNRWVDDSKEATESSSGFLMRKPSLFSNLIQSNDVLFIKLENLQLDEDTNQNTIYLTDNKLLIDPASIKGKAWDMIGLVDNSNLTMVAANNNQGVTIMGRDLSKLLIEDGVYFFPVEYAVKDREQIIKNSSATKSSRRLYMNTNEQTNAQGFEQNIKYLADQGASWSDLQFNFDKTQTIAEWTTFIFSQLTNIDICPDSLFNAYPDKTFIISRETTEGMDDPQYKRIQANGIWQIVKLVLDSNICDRKVVDSSLATDTGSLMNMVFKICQKPFVSFDMDTWGDKYYFSVRKSPFTYESFRSNYTVNVFEADVIADNLDYAADEVYTWYKLNPFASVFGFDENAGFMSIFPAVLLPEYVELWGNKALEINTNFLDFDVFEGEQSSQNFEQIKAQGYEDLDWLIESHAYLPFSRKGVITIKPDRRIKRGMNIRYFPTGELFYVESVTNVRTLTEMSDGLTILTVTRGVQEEHLDKYFKIVNLQKDTKDFNEVWRVNTEIFKFFLARTQIKL